MEIENRKFENETEAFIARCRLLMPGQTVVVGVSGGADSVALVEAMRLIGKYDLHIAHIHHCLRSQADADADFVAELAGKWKIPFHFERFDTPVMAAKERIGIEEAARTGRYHAFRTIASRIGADAVAVAHHADDQVETVIHRIFRGTHMRGLAGITPKRKLDDGLFLIRPLLWARREQIEQFCRDRGLAWRTDHTNAETEFTRNFIRHELLGLLRGRLNVKADEAVLRLAEAAAETESVMSELSQKLFERACRKQSAGRVILRCSPLKKAPPLLASMAMRLALVAMDAPQQEVGKERFDDLLAVLNGTSAVANLPGHIQARKVGSDIHLTRQE